MCSCGYGEPEALANDVLLNADLGVYVHLFIFWQASVPNQVNIISARWSGAYQSFELNQVLNISLWYFVTGSNPYQITFVIQNMAKV